MSEPNVPRFDVMEQLQQLLLSDTGVVDFLRQLARLSTLVVPNQRLSCGIIMRQRHDALTVASSDERAERLDETQYRSHQGPCLEALRTAQLVLSNDLDTEKRWPAYTTMARQEGLCSSLSLPLIGDSGAVGAVNVYGFDVPFQFGPAEQRLYTLFVAQASGALQLATRHANDTALLHQFDEALTSRSIIDQAMGILIGRHGLTSSQAFDLLRRQSQATHHKLRDVASDLITDAAGEPPTTGRPFQTGS